MNRTTDNTTTDGQSAWKICLASRKKFCLVAILSIVCSIVMSISEPTEYEARVTLNMDLSKDDAENISDWAFNMKKNMGADGHIIISEPESYPLIIRSDSFLTKVIQTQVVLSDGSLKPFSEYLLHDSRSAWWEGNVTEDNIIQRVRERNLRCEINRRNWLLVMQSSAQDPFVAAQLLDSACMHLQNYLATYIRQSRIGEYDKLAIQTKLAYEEYTKAKHTYGEYVDSHSDMTNTSYEDYLYSEVQRSFIAYNDLNLQLLEMERKIQRDRPIVYQIQSVTVPQSPARPQWIVNAIVWLFYGMLLTMWYVMFTAKQRKVLY